MDTDIRSATRPAASLRPWNVPLGLPDDPSSAPPSAGAQQRYISDILRLHRRLSFSRLAVELQENDACLYRADHGQGVVTSVALSGSIPERYLLGLAGFRLSEYLQAGFASEDIVYNRSLFCEPVHDFHDADMHVITTDARSGRILGYLALAHSQDPEPRPLAAADRRLFPCEQAHDVRLQSLLPAAVDLTTHQIREVKRFVHAHSVTDRSLRLRITLELLAGLMRAAHAEGCSTRLLIGDVEEHVALRHLLLLGLSVHLLKGTKPKLSRQNVMHGDVHHARERPSLLRMGPGGGGRRKAWKDAGAGCRRGFSIPCAAGTYGRTFGDRGAHRNGGTGGRRGGTDGRRGGCCLMSENVTHREFYEEFTERNRGFISERAQKALSQARILIAGCGSTGGAAVEPLARIGVQDFVLADVGEFELNNLNRQHAAFGDIGRHKADVAAERAMAINPHAHVEVVTHGITKDNVEKLVDGCSVVIDGIDVTERSGWRAKYLLHEAAVRSRRPVLTGYDMAGTQYIRFYDYRRNGSSPFDGRIRAVDIERSGIWSLLYRAVPTRYIPLEMIKNAREHLGQEGYSVPQLVYASLLFGALSTRMTAQILAGESVRRDVAVNVHGVTRPLAAQLRTGLQWPVALVGGLRKLAASVASASSAATVEAPRA